MGIFTKKVVNLQVSNICPMKSALKIFLAGLAVSVAAALWSCNNSGCNDNRSSVPIAQFYSSLTGKSVALDSLQIGGVNAPGDSLLLNVGTAATEVYLPLRANQPDATFFIDYKYKELAAHGVSDRVKISYETIPYFASEECGAMYRYRITSIVHTNQLLDSVAVVAADSVVTNLNIPSLTFYFRAQ